jgi:hypothetical protein
VSLANHRRIIARKSLSRFALAIDDAGDDAAGLAALRIELMK